jgi:hypothetical protein
MAYLPRWPALSTSPAALARVGACRAGPCPSRMPSRVYCQRAGRCAPARNRPSSQPASAPAAPCGSPGRPAAACTAGYLHRPTPTDPRMQPHPAPRVGRPRWTPRGRPSTPLSESPGGARCRAGPCPSRRPGLRRRPAPFRAALGACRRGAGRLGTARLPLGGWPARVELLVGCSSRRAPCRAWRLRCASARPLPPRRTGRGAARRGGRLKGP